MFSVMGRIVNISLLGLRVFFTTTHLCPRSLKTATENGWTHRCGCVPIKLYLQKQAVGHILPMSHSLLTLFQKVNSCHIINDRLPPEPSCAELCIWEAAGLQFCRVTGKCCAWPCDLPSGMVWRSAHVFSACSICVTIVCLFRGALPVVSGCTSVSHALAGHYSLVLYQSEFFCKPCSPYFKSDISLQLFHPTFGKNWPGVLNYLYN